MAEIEDLRRRLEVAEMELKLVLDGSRSQKEAEDLTEGGSRQKEGADGTTVQTSQRPGRKSHRGDEFTMSLKEVVVVVIGCAVDNFL